MVSKYNPTQYQAKAKNLCACGCGALAIRRFVNGHNTRVLPSEEQARRGQLNDGSALRDRGLKDTYRKVGHRHEHRTIAEEKLGRELLPHEIVHHKDRAKRNNDPSNLEVTTRQEHIEEHREELRRGRNL